MPVAACVIRSGPVYRQECFIAGLKACGYEVVLKAQSHPKPEDLIVVWNRNAQYDWYAQRYERAGAAVIVAENGWIGRARDGGKLYALARDHHNGAGRWVEGQEDRWARCGVELQPWRSDGESILVLAQRG